MSSRFKSLLCLLGVLTATGAAQSPAAAQAKTSKSPVAQARAVLDGGGGGGGTEPVPYFGDAQNTRTTGAESGWDLLDHRGWSYSGDSFTVVRRVNTNGSTGADGHLGGGTLPTYSADVWQGSGIASADSKEIDTLTYMKSQLGGPGLK